MVYFINKIGQAKAPAAYDAGIGVIFEWNVDYRLG